MCLPRHCVQSSLLCRTVYYSIAYKGPFHILYITLCMWSVYTCEESRKGGSVCKWLVLIYLVPWIGCSNWYDSLLNNVVRIHLLLTLQVPTLFQKCIRLRGYNLISCSTLVCTICWSIATYVTRQYGTQQKVTSTAISNSNEVTMAS